jgi:hypothetical protein
MTTVLRGVHRSKNEKLGSSLTCELCEYFVASLVKRIPRMITAGIESTMQQGWTAVKWLVISATNETTQKQKRRRKREMQQSTVNK